MALSYADAANLWDRAQRKGKTISKELNSPHQSRDINNNRGAKWIQTVARFPLFPSGVVLHEEHIELFSPDFKQLKKDVAGKQLEEGSLHFTGTITSAYL